MYSVYYISDGHGLPKYTKLVTEGTDDTTVVSTTANASRSTVGNSQRGQFEAILFVNITFFVL